VADLLPLLNNRRLLRFIHICPFVLVCAEEDAVTKPGRTRSLLQWANFAASSRVKMIFLHTSIDVPSFLSLSQSTFDCVYSFRL
jgi:hypothetical protein